jgi:hypothetical protein
VDNESTTPWHYTVDFKIDRKLDLGAVQAILYVYVQNAFNRKNAQQVYLNTGTTTEDGAHTPNVRAILIANYGEEFLALYDHINHQHRQHYQIMRGGDLFGRPREIRFGLQMAF